MPFLGVWSTALKRGGRKPANNVGFEKKPFQRMFGKHLHLLIDLIIIAPDKKMVKRILGKSQGRRKKG